MNPFTDYPASVGESYPAHWRVATRFGLRMIGGGVAALVHGVFPFLFTTTGSRTIEALHGEIVAKRADEVQKRTVEFVI
ncbi:DUF6356 family protein [Sphingomonas sp. RP10(2022)]|uniref:DUF6356 family protein n=1 Tax=Sphingomonas liriopis TaxID=2949094 RepID=A0A9X2HQB8_9SPHN|nr:DUF6356 family protein [Sphingomonas liriopis]MCP3733867.1 DUF6356 family protein [Sphingomonas liriopis]